MLSDKEYVLSQFETPNMAMPLGFISHDVDYQSRNPMHTLPYEQGGMSMIDFVKAMKLDAELQVDVLGLLSERLDLIVHINDQRKVYCKQMEVQSLTLADIINEQKTSIACFEGNRSPITASKYVQRILKYGRVSECCFLVAVIYIERLKLAGHAIRLSSTSLQRLLAVAVMVAAKFLDEPFYANKWW